MRRVRLALLVLVVLALAGAFAWRTMQPPIVAVARATRGPAIDAVYATGLVEPSLEIRIAPRAGGRIVELRADEGDDVRKGQVLARLEDADLQASVAELEARAAYAKSQYDRSVELRRAALISVDALERSRTDLDAAQATLRRAQDQVAYMRLVAPADGRIIRRDGEVGEYVGVNETVFHMAGPAPLRITSDVDEEDVPRVTPGLPVMIRTDAFPDRVFDGRVEQVTPRGDPIARSYRVRIALEGDPPLQIGMSAETNIVLARREDALLVPAASVVDGRVFIVENGRAVERKVQTGVVGATRTEIRSGLEGTESIIASPPEGLAPGRRVRIAP